MGARLAVLYEDDGEHYGQHERDRDAAMRGDTAPALPLPAALEYTARQLR
jgi:hypothetical protein